MYKTYKYYDHKGRRCSIYGVEDNNTIRVVIVHCSKQDKFSKKVSNSIYSDITLNPLNHPYKCLSHFTIPIIDNKPGKSFINWCEANYYKERTEYRVFMRKILIKGSDFNTIPLTKYKLANTKLSQKL